MSQGDSRDRDDATTVLAAGCVLWRHTPRGTRPTAGGARPTAGGTRPTAGGGGLEIALVHRPRYDDWSHPKGKLKRGEDALHCAVREVVEETGMGCTPGVELPTLRYVARGRPKEVRYWAAEAVPDDTFVPNREVDRLLWLPPAAARDRLTYDHDRTLVDALLTALDAA